MSGEINVSVLLRFMAQEARREVAATGNDLKTLGASAEEAGRKATSAGQSIDQAGAAAGSAATDISDAGTAWANTATQAANASAQMGRSAVSVAGTRDAVTGLASASTSALPSITSLTSMVGASSTAMQSALAATTGLTRSLEDQTAAMLQEQKASAAWQAELDGIRAKFNPLFAATQQYEAYVREVAEAERLGAITAEEATAARERSRAAMTQVTANLGQYGSAVQQTSGHTANLFSQWNDIAVMMAAGQNPMQLALQQGTQVSQVLMQLGGGTKALRAVGSSFLAMLNPISLATIGIIAFGAAGVKWLMSLSGETKTFDEELEDLNGTLGRMKSNLDLLGQTRLETTFGNLTGSVRDLAQGMVELDRASELKQLQGVIDTFLDKEVDPSFWSKFSQSISLGAAPMPGLTVDDYLTGDNIRRENYTNLGAANSFEDFQKRTAEINELAKSGNVTAVVEKIRELQAVMSNGGAVSDMSDELRALLGDMSKVSIETAKIEALWNGTAQAEAMARQINQIVQGYREQTELAQASLQYGENSAEVEAVRARHARQALQLKLDDLGVEEDSTEAKEAQAALEAQIAADAERAAQSRQKAQDDYLADLHRQEELSIAILRYGENSAEVEAVRAAHAQDVLRARLEEKGYLPEIVAEALKLTEAERERANAIKAAGAARKADDLLASLREEAQINQAILAYGQDSLQVKELQIAAARREFEQTLATMQVSEQIKTQLREAWDIARGMSATDPFGVLASSGDYLRDQQQRIEQLKLEQSLLGQQEATRSRILALWTAELDIRKMGLEATSVRAQEIRAAAIEEAELTRTIERQKDAWDSVQSAAESAIDGIIDKLKGGDFDGALEEMASLIADTFTELAITNPLKNAMLGTNLGTMSDVGGLKGIWDRLTGKADTNSLEKAAMDAARSVGTMQVTAANVTISTMGDLGLGAANSNASPSSYAAGTAGAPYALGGLSGGTLSLTPADIVNLKKTVATEWVQGAGDAQAQGIIDTILNRMASGKWGNSVAGVVNARSQFSDINGPVAWAAGRSSVDDIPMSMVTSKIDTVVDTWLRQRAGGVGSSVGDHLSYANPFYSDASNMSWIRELQGPVYGSGDAIHQHGTPAWMQGLRPGAFGVSLPGTELQDFSTTVIDATQNLGTLGTGFDSFGQALAQALSGSGGGSGSGLLGSLIGPLLGSLGIPGFATGGNHVGGLRIVGENGPELEYTGPSTILPADLTRSLMTSRAPSSNQASAPAVIQMQPVLVNNTSVPVQVETEETVDSRGQRQQKYVISELVGTGITTKGGKTQRALAGTYGLTRGGMRRE